MATQSERDLEDFMWGQQGVKTGSLYNELGSLSKPKPIDPYPFPAPGKKEKVQPAPRSVKVATDTKDFSSFFSIIAFIISCLYFYNPADENGVATLIGAIIAAYLAGKLYKVIIGFGILIMVLFFFAAIGESPQ